jgi:cytochrome c peroxidase
MPRRAAELRPQTILVGVCLLLVVLWLATGASALGSSQRRAPSGPHVVPPSRIRRVFERGLDVLADDLARLDTVLAASRIEDSRRAFVASRSAFKRTEALLAFYSPTTFAKLDGPAEEESADDAPQALGRQGAFQTIEATLFDAKDATLAWDEARHAATTMRQSLASFRSATVLLDVADTAGLDAARLEIARIATLGLAGFDTNLPDHSISECADALDGLRLTLAQLSGAPRDARMVAADRAIDITLDSAVHALRDEPRFEQFDRLRFVTRYVTPAANAVLAARRLIDAKPVNARRAWRPSSASPYGRDAFDPSAFAPEYAPATSTPLIALGERLFNDARLSGPQTRSCASCHIAATGFADGRRHAAALSGDSATPSPLRNTPTLWNVALQPFLFADQRAGSLEQQVGFVLASPAEMASSAVLAAQRIQRDTSYLALVSRTSDRQSASLDERTVRTALAAYLRALVGLDSRFDRAVQGDSTALTDSERRGFTVFMGKGRCGTCHFAPLFSGVMPPEFTRSELEIIGVPRTNATHDANVDPDSGRAHVDGLGVHAHAFKVPTLRNVALTAPYMHNGVFATLDDVVEFYNRGGGAGIGEHLAGQTLPARPLGLSIAERRDLVAFLRALTDSSAIRTAMATP